MRWREGLGEEGGDRLSAKNPKAKRDHGSTDRMDLAEKNARPKRSHRGA
jgi:hypothetical protein